MNPIDEFQDVGKKIPYRVPDDFFEKLSNPTLQWAKRREKKHKKMVYLRRMVSVAASLVAIAVFGYFYFESKNPDNKPLVQEKRPQIEKTVDPKSEMYKEPVAGAIKNKVHENAEPEVNSAEDMNDILAGISNEELMQLAARYKTDPFIDESSQQ